MLLKTSNTLKACFKKLSKNATDDGFEKLWAQVVANQSTAEQNPSGAGLSASSKDLLPQRLLVPTGRKPLDLFDHTVWTKMDPVCFLYNDCVCGDILVDLVR